MNKLEIVKEIKKFFKIQEFVDERTFKRWGDNAWNFLDDKLLETIIVLRRDILKVPLVCNDWSWGGKNQQRGLRTNLSPLVKDKSDKGILYLTQHAMGKAVDFVSNKMSADQMRKLIKENANKLPYQCRVEDGASAPTWLHIDTMSDMNQREKLYFFK